MLQLKSKTSRNEMMGNKKQNKIEILQCLRGIAAMGIVYFHTEYGPWKSANWGVDFFFILSGFLMMLSTKSWRGGRRYWLSRIIKICPLYWGMTVIVIILYQFVPNVFRSTTVTGETIIKSILFIPCYAAEGRIFPIYSVAWTITLEMFFYFVFYVCIRINYKNRGRIAIVILLALVICGKIIPFDNAILAFWTDKHLIEFVVGIVIYMFYEKGWHQLNSYVVYLFMFVEIIMLFSGKYVLKEQFSYVWNLVFGSLLLMTGLSYGKKECNGFLVELGNMSYSIYMIHFLIVGFVVRMLIDNNTYSIKNTVVVIFAVIVVIPVSYLIYRIMEVYFVKKWKVF